jgi:hypothetical protein
MSQDTELGSAIEAVARDLIAKALAQAINFENVGWEDYGDIGGRDYEAVVKRAEELAELIRRPAEVFEAAYDFLTERAEEPV